MHLTIVKPDNQVGVDGVFYTIDCSELPANFWALQWDGPTDGINGFGEAEWTGSPKPPNTEVVNLDGFYPFYEAWLVEDYKAKNPPPPPAPDMGAPQEGPSVVA